MQRRPGTAGETKPFLDHLTDLRTTVIHSLLCLAAGMLVALPLAPLILRAVKAPLVRIGIDPASFLRVIHVAGGLSVTLRVVFWSGLVLSLPFVLLVIGRFVLPALREREKRMLFHSAGLAVAFFVAGVALAYVVILPLSVRMIMRINAWLGVSWAFVELGDYVSFVLRLLLAFGLTFELPVLVLGLGRLGLLHSRQLRAWRSYVVVGILVAAMLLTPPDPVTQVAMGLPLILLYEACIWMIWFGERAKRRQED